ncbi:MAG: undecaprenyl-diphosphate phosphatase [Micropruina sp.]|uniref:undecaprenyl-diphosphate phosphatase n=1 Tax=Micropruina sp. TaxID=2737536 RepID=UPI0039E3FF60
MRAGGGWAASWFHAIVLGIIEGLTEFLPVSSTGHITIAEQLIGYPVSSPAITAFTAVIQLGSILAAVVFFGRDILRIAGAWIRGIADPKARTLPDYRMGWNVIVGSIPIAVVGLLGKDLIEGPLRSLWVVVAGLLGWSAVMWLADRRTAVPGRGEASINLLDAVVVGLVQCCSLVPGVSRSGATISAGLLRGIDRPTATRFSFFMGIPALIAAGGLEAVSQAGTISATIGWGPVLIGIVVAFITGYASIAWLLRFVSRHTFTAFIVYRIAAAGVLVWLLCSGLVAAG